MNRKKFFLPLLLIIIIINAAGFALRYFELDTFFILLGFRFHLSFILPFLLILKYVDLSSLKEIFVHPAKQKFILLLFFSFFPLLFIPADFFIIDQFKMGRQDYFYELGLSSITDYPVYLVWNAPQFFMLFIFMNRVLGNGRYKFIKASLIVLLLFLYEIIPFDGELDYSRLASCFFGVLITGLFISRIQNIYIFAVSLFTIMWVYVLSFGSNSETLVNIFLASQYENWAGFVIITKKNFIYEEYLAPAYLLLMFLVSLIAFRKKQITSES